MKILVTMIQYGLKGRGSLNSTLVENPNLHHFILKESLPEILTNRKSFGRLEVSPTPSLGSKLEFDNSAYSFSESEAEIEEKKKKMAFVSKQNCIPEQKQSTSAESSSLMADLITCRVVESIHLPRTLYVL